MNVLIIDDEQLIRENVFHQVNSLPLAIDHVYQTDSADGARRILDKTSIDIFLCDIVMPEEDGIAFAHWAGERYPDSKFIFLTSHSDFEYMKEAISLRSFDYILQPAPAEELNDVLGRAIMEIRLDQEKRHLLEEAEFLKDRDANILEILGGRYLRGFSGSSEFFDRYLEQTWQKDPHEAVILPFYVKVLASGRNWMSAERALLRFVYQNIVNEIMAPLSMQSAVFLDDENFVDALILLGTVGEDTANSYERLQMRESTGDLKKVLENMRILVNKVLETKIAIYVSGICHFDEVCQAVSDILGEVRDTVRDISCVRVVGKGEKTNSSDSMLMQASSWKALLGQNRIEDFRHSLMNYLERCTEGSPVSKEFILKIYQQVSELILGKIVAEGLNTDDIFDEELSYYDFMYCTSEYSVFVDVINRTLDRLSDKLEKQFRDPVAETIHYIHDHIDRDISVQELADIAEMSPEYLSRLFKRGTGFNLKKYIVHEKMEAAKQLLTTTSLSVTAISGHVGYHNYSNFTYTFRMMFNETPTEYRNRTNAEREGQE